MWRTTRSVWELSFLAVVTPLKGNPKSPSTGRHSFNTLPTEYSDRKVDFRQLARRHGVVIRAGIRWSVMASIDPHPRAYLQCCDYDNGHSAGELRRSLPVALTTSGHRRGMGIDAPQCTLRVAGEWFIAWGSRVSPFPILLFAFVRSSFCQRHHRARFRHLFNLHCCAAIYFTFRHGRQIGRAHV